MPNRNQFILIPALSVIAICLIVYFFFYKNSKANFVSASYAIPESTIALYIGNEPEKTYTVLQETEIYKFLTINLSVKQFDAYFSFFDSLINKKDKLKRLFLKNPLIVSLHLTGNESMDLLFLNQTEGIYNKEEYFSFFKELNPTLQFSERNFDGNPVYDAKNEKQENVFSFTLLDGILALSHNPVLVEDAINTYKTNKSKQSELCSAIANGDKKDKIYVNYSNVPKLFEMYLKPVYRKEIENLQKYVGFGCYNLVSDEGKIELTGGIYSGSESNVIPDIFKGQNTNNSDLTKILTNRTAILINWNVSNFAKYSKDIDALNKSGDIKSKRKVLEQKGGFTFDNLYKILKGEWAYSVPELKSQGDSVSEILIFKIDSSKAGILDSINSRFQLEKPESPLTYKSYKISHSALSNLPELLFGKLFTRFSNSYYSITGEYAIFSTGEAEIKSCIDAQTSGQNLYAKETYQKFKKDFLPTSNFLFYVNPARAYSLAEKFLKEDILEDFKKNTSLFNGIDGFAFQANENKSKVLIAKLSGEEKTAEIVWQISLEAKVATSPQLLKNFDNTQSIFVTDDANNAYLINDEGKIIWKRLMDAPLSGSATNLDLYQNENTQYLFSSKNTLYLIDKDGKDVGNYPLHLGSRSTSGVALFDYNNTKNYRYFVGTQNNRIYGYNANGKPISGWNPQIIDAPLVLPMNYFTIKDNIYLYGVSNRGTLYVWKPNGEKAIKQIELKDRFKNSFKLKIGNSLKTSALISMDTLGMVYKVSLDGEINKKEYKISGENAYFDYLDVDGNGKNEYVIGSGKVISASEKDGKRTWKVNTSANLTYAPQFFTIGSKSWISYINEEKNKVNLISTNGTNYKSFPLPGNMPVIIDDFKKDGTIEMISVTEPKKIMMYRLSR